jgi:hypothetical protein
MNSKIKLILLILLTLPLFEQCKTKTNADKSRQTEITPLPDADAATRFDTIKQQLKNNRGIKKTDILKFGVI